MAKIEDPETVALTLRLPETLHADLTRIAEREDRSLAWVIRYALGRFVTQPEEALREPRR